jgi:hypothetical protein
LLRPFSVVALLLGGCFARPDHPVTTSPRPTAFAPLPPGAAVGEVPEPGPPSGRAARLVFLADLANALGPLEDVRRRAPDVAASPLITALPDTERSVKARFRQGGPNGPVREVVAAGVGGRVPISPRAMADLMTDPVVEREVLAATSVRVLGTDYDVPGASRRTYDVEMRDMGAGTMRFHLRFAMTTERWDLPDGTVLLRYDLRPDPPPRRVTLWRGACLLEPDPEGALVSEFLVVGTDIRVPGLFQGMMRKLSFGTLEDRAVNLFRRARAGR